MGLHSTYDDCDPDEIHKVIEDTISQYRIKQFVDAVIQCDISLAIAEALEDDE